MPIIFTNTLKLSIYSWKGNLRRFAKSKSTFTFVPLNYPSCKWSPFFFSLFPQGKDMDALLPTHNHAPHPSYAITLYIICQIITYMCHVDSPKPFIT